MQFACVFACSETTEPDGSVIGEGTGGAGPSAAGSTSFGAPAESGDGAGAVGAGGTIDSGGTLSGSPNGAAGDEMGASEGGGGTLSGSPNGAAGDEMGASEGGASSDGASAAGSPSGSPAVAGAGGQPEENTVASANAPSGLLVELTSHVDGLRVTDSTPEFAWVVHASDSHQVQTAYRVLVASSQVNLDSEMGDMWDSGETASDASVNVSYAGEPLAASATYYFKVKTWDSSGAESPWSAPQSFTMNNNLASYSTPTPPVEQRTIAPVSVVELGTGHYFLDFGRAAFGWVELTLDAPGAGRMSVSLGEKASGMSVDMNPGGSIRANSVDVSLQQGVRTYRVQAPNNGGAIPIPNDLGVVMPFRYVEVNNSPVALTEESALQVAVMYPFDEEEASFSSSDATLNDVWDLSAYSIKATTFANMYVDGDRERKPYEADAYIQQLGHYALDRDYALGRKTHEYLMRNSTWPTEWKFHSIMMAWADWMYTGNTESLAQHYDALKQSKTLESYANSDGLLDTGSLEDIVDWPEGERDGYVLTPINTVVNSFYCYVLGLMGDMAEALGNDNDASRYRSMATTATAALNSQLFNTSTGLYVDGQSSTHSSLHANMFPLAFGLVPADRQANVVSFIQERGMACSVYGAQYLLEALYRAGQADAALALLTATHDRSWMNMLNVGSTITLEAWDAKYKPNLDWNHAWGAAPANILPRYILGVRPLSAGFAKAVIDPQPGSLTHVEGTVPTIRGPVQVVVDTAPLSVSLTLPANMTADVAVPPTDAACVPSLDGQAATVVMSDDRAWIQDVGSGTHSIGCQ